MARRRSVGLRGQVWAVWERALILAFSHKGLIGGRLLALGRGLDARDTLILAFSRKGRRDPLVADCTWFCVEVLAAIVWIPAFAGMTRGRNREWRGIERLQG